MKSDIIDSKMGPTYKEIRLDSGLKIPKLLGLFWELGTGDPGLLWASRGRGAQRDDIWLPAHD